MRRSLILVDETARHPFLRSLPPHVRRGGKAIPARPQRRSRLDGLRDFLMAYCACFLAVTTFLL